MVVCRVNVQMIQDKEPSTSKVEMGCPASLTVLKIALSVYRGEVPMSPYTIPKLMSKPAADNL